MKAELSTLMQKQKGPTFGETFYIYCGTNEKWVEPVFRRFLSNNVIVIVFYGKVGSNSTKLESFYGKLE